MTDRPGHDVKLPNQTRAEAGKKILSATIPHTALPFVTPSSYCLCRRLIMRTNTGHQALNTSPVHSRSGSRRQHCPRH